ncbi:MAG: hypothetical protein ACP5F8_01320 [Candidatus Aenigmatarchaeota archaeon]
MKAQIATEYLILVSFSLMVLIPYILYLYSISQQSNEQNILTVASESVKKIGEACDWVYLQGEPAKITIKIAIPKNVEEISFLNRTINWKVRTSAGVSDIYYNCIANVSGYLPIKEGEYYVSIQAFKGGVNINVTSS